MKLISQFNFIYFQCIHFCLSSIQNTLSQCQSHFHFCLILSQQKCSIFLSSVQFSLYIGEKTKIVKRHVTFSFSLCFEQRKNIKSFYFLFSYFLFSYFHLNQMQCTRLSFLFWVSRDYHIFSFGQRDYHIKTITFYMWAWECKMF